jgi:hypothetical protein
MLRRRKTAAQTLFARSEPLYILVGYRTPAGFLLSCGHALKFRMCGSGESAEIQLLGYSARQARPALVINTGASWLELLIQTGNALIVQAVDGVTSSALFVAQFRNGDPVLVAKDRTTGGVSYSEDHSEVSLRLHEGSAQSLRRTRRLEIGDSSPRPGCSQGFQERRIREFCASCHPGRGAP